MHCLVVICTAETWRMQVKGESVMSVSIAKLKAYSLYELRLTVTNEGGMILSSVNVTTLSKGLPVEIYRIFFF